LINTKFENYENLNVFLMRLIVPYYYKKFEDEINCIMRAKGPFLKVMSLNENVKHPLSKPNFDIGNFLIHLIFFNIHIIQ
jgi:hypothetical protein